MLDPSLALIQTKGNLLLSPDGLQSGSGPMKMSDEMAYFYENAKRFRTRKRAPNDAFDEPTQEFVGAIGNLYGRKQLSPPFLTREYARRWLAEGIPAAHCLEIIREHLEVCAHQYRSGSGDQWIDRVDALIHFKWYAREPTPPVWDMWDHLETWFT
jgi:hypothetical protein